jgi:formate dehydrogenase
LLALSRAGLPAEAAVELNRRSCLSGWLRAVQKYRGYISETDFASVLRDESEDQPLNEDAGESDDDHAHVCVGLACALSGAEEFCQSLVESGIIRSDAITRETCLAQCWRAPAIVHNSRVHSGAGEDADFAGDADFESYCALGGYGVMKSCLAKRRSSESIICALSSAAVRLFEKAEVPFGVRIRELRAHGTTVKVVMLIDEDGPGEMAQSFFLSQFPHRVLEGLLIVAHTLGASEVVLSYTRRHESTCRKFYKEFLFLQDRGLGSNVQLALIDADRQTEQQSLRQICLSSNSKEPSVSALVADPEFLSWIPEIVATGDTGDADAPNGPQTLYALVGCVKHPGIYKAPVFSTVHDLIALAGGIRPGESLHSFVPGDWDRVALPAHHSNLRVDAEILGSTERMTFPIVFISKNDNLLRQTAFQGFSQ